MDGGGDNQLSMRYFERRRYQEMILQRVRFEEHPDHAAEYRAEQRHNRLMEQLLLRAIREARGRRRAVEGRGAGRAERLRVGMSIALGDGPVCDIGGGDGLAFPIVDVHFRAWHPETPNDDSGFESGSEGD